MLAEIQLLGKDTTALAAAPLWSLSDDQVTDSLKAAHRLEQAATALKVQLVRQACSRALPAAHGFRTPARWLRELLLVDPQPARELVEQATALSRHTIVEQAVLDGAIDLRQAAEIATTMAALPTDLAAIDTDADPDMAVDPATVDPAAADPAAADPAAADPAAADPAAADPAAADPAAADPAVADPVAPGTPELVRQAAHTMIDMAGRLSAFQLRHIGERILAHVAPYLADQAEAAALARQEARAHRRRGFTLSLPVDGLVRLSGQLGAEDAATLKAALHPLCRPTPDDDRTPPQRRADALIEICRLALRTGDLPDDGGQPAQLAVTVAYDPLTRTLGTATTDTGERLSPASARRLACDAQLLPILLGGAGQILDAGRTRRTATGPLRRALHVRDQGCAFPDCDRPPRWTDAHHITAWTTGAATDLDNLVLLCRAHHRLIHHPTAGWHLRLGPDRQVEFLPPPHIDPSQGPRRNLYRLRQ
ncbi:HNH endonuclease [Actinoplanes bogorensis]|uniref:HNH endonuclease n=1 Tax=Paractinoplanes bogorensis TaxID=1610840 RepID=A0ABS5YLK7_9ACTN|nr:HNH endonuclease signature motif containing protein [Actinoplanes bogorensis]MBU2664325.1 HNH endonuclease [Actinoplanes bogorensis]